MGSTPPFFILFSSSVPSSIMVRSAAKSTSNTLSAPRRRIADTILPVQRVPMGRPNSSPMATRTAGAVWNTTYLSGSLSAAHTSLVASFSVSAPVGQAAMHWPQLMQATSLRLLPNSEPTCVLKPRFCIPMAYTPCVLAQAATQRRQSMHLLLSLTMLGLNSSMVFIMRSPGNSISSMPISLARACSSQD